MLLGESINCKPRVQLRYTRAANSKTRGDVSRSHSGPVEATTRELEALSETKRKEHLWFCRGAAYPGGHSALLHGFQSAADLRRQLANLLQLFFGIER